MSQASNTQFYQDIDIESFIQHSSKVGLNTGCDVDQIYEAVIKQSASILEVGAGYGRVIKTILAKGYTGHISAVERNEQLCLHLEKTFKDNIKLYNSDIQKLSIAEKFDTILWLWSGLSEFPKDRQKDALLKLSSMLNSGGSLVIDVLDIARNDIKKTDGLGLEKKIILDAGVCKLYLPSEQEIERYSVELGCTLSKPIYYKTLTNRDRIIFLFNKA